MKIAETDTTLGELIERLSATGKPLSTKAKAFIYIEDEAGQTQGDVQTALAGFREGFKDLPSEEIEQIIEESVREVRAQKA